jgi:hypothetical protein
LSEKTSVSSASSNHGNTFILDGAAIPAIPTTDLYTSLRSQNYFGDILDGTAIPAIPTTETCCSGQTTIVIPPCHQLFKCAQVTQRARCETHRRLSHFWAQGPRREKVDMWRFAVAHREGPHPTLQNHRMSARTAPFNLIFRVNLFTLGRLCRTSHRICKSKYIHEQSEPFHRHVAVDGPQ